jgi:hypothetical protein
VLVVSSAGEVVEVVFVLVLIDVAVDMGSVVTDVTVTGSSIVGAVVVVVVVVVVVDVVVVVVVVGTTLRLVIALAAVAVTFEPMPNWP